LNTFIGDWGLGIGDWGLPNPQSPIPKVYVVLYYKIYYYYINKTYKVIKK